MTQGTNLYIFRRNVLQLLKVAVIHENQNFSFFLDLLKYLSPVKNDFNEVIKSLFLEVDGYKNVKYKGRKC